MPRRVEFAGDKLTLHLEGLTRVAALVRKVEIPFSKIKKVTVEDAKISLFAIRVGTSIADIREGRFRLEGKWCLVSYENHKRVVVLELQGHKYWKVIFQTGHPEELKERIENYIRE